MDQADLVKLQILKEDLQNLLDEFASSYDLHLEFSFNDAQLLIDPSTGREKVFTVELTAFNEKNYDDGSKELKGVVEKAGPNAIFEKNWNRFAHSRGLNVSLLGKVIELNSAKQHRIVRYRILGLNSTSRRKKYCVAMQDLSTGTVWGGAPGFVNTGKVIS